MINYGFGGTNHINYIRMYYLKYLIIFLKGKILTCGGILLFQSLYN